MLSFTFTCASARSVSVFLPFTSWEKKLPISFPYTTVKVIAVAIAVCQENREESTCFHTGVAFFPAAVSASYSFRAEANASVNMGMLLEMARKNICGPIAMAGSSRAICCMLIFTLLSLGAGSSPNMGVEFVFFFWASSSFSSTFNCSTTPARAWISAICASVFVPDDMACLNWFCSSLSWDSSCAITLWVYLPISPRFPSTDRIPLSVLSSSSISSLTGSIYPPSLV